LSQAERDLRGERDKIKIDCLPLGPERIDANNNMLSVVIISVFIFTFPVHYIPSLCFANILADSKRIS